MVPKRAVASGRQNTQVQNERAKHRREERKVRSCSAGWRHNIYPLGGTQMSPQKHPNTERIGGPGASHENRRQPEKSKAHGEREEHIRSDNAREREQAKRIGNANIDQQGNRANVRQNTTRQGNRRSP